MHATHETTLAHAAAEKPRKAGARFEERGRYSLDDGGTLVVEHAPDCDALNQTVSTRLRFTRHDRHGKEIERSESSWASRYLFRYEAIHLLHRCGFVVESLAGDYDGGPVTEDGQLVFQAALEPLGS